MRSIKDNITEDVLLNEINEIIRLPMYADRIQHESKAHPHNSSRRRWQSFFIKVDDSNLSLCSEGGAVVVY